MLTPGERCETEAAAAKMSSLRRQGGDIKQQAVDTTDSADLGQLVPYEPVVALVPRPMSTVRWLQNPSEPPEQCVNLSRRQQANANYRSKYPVSTSSFDAVKADITSADITEMASAWRLHNDMAPPPCAKFTQSIYPKHCGPLCKKCHTPTLFKIGFQIKMAIIRLMNSLGGFSKVGEKDAVFVCESHRRGRVTNRHYCYMPSGFGKPQAADLILLQPETGATDPPFISTYAKGQFVQPQGEYPSGLSSTDPPLYTMVDEEFAEMVIRTSPSPTHCVIVLLDAEFTDSDSILIKGEASHSLGPILCNGGKTSKAAASGGESPHTAFAAALLDDDPDGDPDDSPAHNEGANFPVWVCLGHFPLKLTLRAGRVFTPHCFHPAPLIASPSPTSQGLSHPAKLSTQH